MKKKIHRIMGKYDFFMYLNCFLTFLEPRGYRGDVQDVRCLYAAFLAAHRHRSSS